MRFSLRQKQILVALLAPVLRFAYLWYGLLTLDLFRDHRLPGSEASSHDGRPPPAVDRILLLRLDGVGDVLLSEPAMAAMRRHFPQARIDVIVSPDAAPLLTGNPHVDRVLSYEAPWHAAWRGKTVRWWRALVQVAQVLRAFRREGYDLGVELRGDLRDILFLVGCGARVRVGNGGRGGGFLLHYDVPWPEKAHQVELGLRLTASVGAVSAPTAPRLYPSPAHRAQATLVLPRDHQVEYVAFHLGGGFPSKCLPLAHFAQVAHALWSSDEQRVAVLVGGPGERELAQEFLKRAPITAIDLTGRLLLLETAAVLERCRLFIGNDSAPMHLAAAMGTPIVTFFGPSEPWRFHPYGVDFRLLEVDLACRPCDYVHCIYLDTATPYRCMTQQSVEAIVTAAEELLAIARPQAHSRIV